MRRKNQSFLILLALLSASAAPGFGESARYALVLQDEPVIKTASRGGRHSLEAVSVRQTILQKQSVLRRQLESQGFRVTSSTEAVLNAMFVEANPEDVAKLRAMPGVRYVSKVRMHKLELNAAINLVDAPNAWALLGGIGTAGAGIKIAIIDTGIDNHHPAFQDATLSIPTGYPICDLPANCAFTNNKIIVARSYRYLQALAAYGGPSNSRPDDFSARDRVGHGTSVAMAAAGNTVAAPLATISGLAPHAYLGSYKVNGSPGINDYSSSEGFIDALNDAFNDGMDVVVYSSGGPVFNGPLESGAVCGNPAGQICDPEVEAAENAIKTNQMVVVAAAGNAGFPGQYSTNTVVSAYDTVGAPAFAPDVIAVAATGNARVFGQGVQIAGPAVPQNIQNLGALSGGGVPSATLTATLVDAGNAGDLYACGALTANSLKGSIALIERGPAANPCTFADKVSNAENAGAAGVLIYDDVAESLEDLGSIDVGNASVPVFQITLADGQNVKAYVDQTPAATAALNPAATAITSSTVNQVARFSSRGPIFSSDGNYGLKPDIAAPGTSIYTAACSTDPNCAVYSPGGYSVEDGTSYSTPIVGGIAALLLQNNPTLTALQIRSALINTATNDTSDPWVGAGGMNPSGVLAVGGGKVEALNALKTNVTSNPATLSFGSPPAGFTTATQAFSLTNIGTASVTLALAISQRTPDSKTTLTLSATTATIAAGQSQSINLTLSGAQSAPGIYEGAVTVTGGAQPLHIPFFWVVGDGVPFNLVSYTGTGNTGVVGQLLPGGDFLSLQVFDQYGVAVPNLPVTWTATSTAKVISADSKTDGNGFAGASAVLGTAPGQYTYTAQVGGGLAPFTFTDSATAQPVFATGGIGNAASFQLGNGIAPGSYIVLFGTALSDTTDPATFTPLPIQIDSVSVAFDGPLQADGTRLEAVAPLNYVSPGQINALVPWELSGLTGVVVKVNNDQRAGVPVTIPVTVYSPAIFPYPDPNGTNVAAAVDVTSGTVVTSANPVARGNYVSLYCNGLGPLSNQPATGNVALASPLSATTTATTVTIGGQAATVQFSGLAPGFVGLYQVNVQVPASVSVGAQPVIVSIGGQTSPALNLAVK